jgi:hypothetical protein
VLSAAPGTPGAAGAPLAQFQGEALVAGDDVQARQLRSGPWPFVAAFCAAGWLATSLWWWRSRRMLEPRPAEPPRSSPKALLAACRTNDAAAARRELLAWVRGQGFRGPLAAWLRSIGSAELTQAVDELEAALYRAGAEADAWNGGRLAAAIEALDAGTSGGKEPDGLPALYPG